MMLSSRDMSVRDAYLFFSSSFFRISDAKHRMSFLCFSHPSTPTPLSHRQFSFFSGLSLAFISIFSWTSFSSCNSIRCSSNIFFWATPRAVQAITVMVDEGSWLVIMFWFSETNKGGICWDKSCSISVNLSELLPFISGLGVKLGELWRDLLREKLEGRTADWDLAWVLGIEHRRHYRYLLTHIMIRHNWTVVRLINFGQKSFKLKLGIGILKKKIRVISIFLGLRQGIVLF